MTENETIDPLYIHWMVTGEDLTTKRENRRYMRKVLRKGIKWTLITAGVFAVAGYFAPEKNTTQEVK
jgi:hypothetical protein